MRLVAEWPVYMRVIIWFLILRSAGGISGLLRYRSSWGFIGSGIADVWSNLNSEIGNGDNEK